MGFKNTLGKVASIYSDVFDPLLFQKRYAHNTLKKKRSTIEFDKIDPETIRKIKGLWGKKMAGSTFIIRLAISQKVIFIFLMIIFLIRLMHH